MILITAQDDYLVWTRFFLLGGVLIAVLTHAFAYRPNSRGEDDIYLGTLFSVLVCALYQAIFVLAPNEIFPESILIVVSALLIRRELKPFKRSHGHLLKKSIFSWYVVLIISLYAVVKVKMNV